MHFEAASWVDGVVVEVSCGSSFPLLLHSQWKSEARSSAVSEDEKESSKCERREDI